ncbi:MAG: hypothetical protein IIA50_02080 [Bacteroidetes bacterium]|nr:hypothetical protein [Bacteroidota bacterium]
MDPVHITVYSSSSHHVDSVYFGVAKEMGRIGLPLFETVANCVEIFEREAFRRLGTTT